MIGSKDPVTTGDEFVWNLVFPFIVLWFIFRGIIGFLSKFYLDCGINLIVAIIVLVVLMYRQYWLQVQNDIW